MAVLIIAFIGVTAGMLATRRQRGDRPMHIVVALAGAFVGAMAAMGDAPLLLRWPVLNPVSLAILGACTGIALLKLVRRPWGRANGG